MNKIDKIEKELEKAREKAAEWQAKIRELEKQKQEETQTAQEPPAETESQPETQNPFSTDGTGTVVDNATDEDGKEFYTITTPDENIFYLVIDKQKTTDNVYFLNAVTKADLLPLAEKSEEETETPVPEPEPEPEPEPPEEVMEPEPDAPDTAMSAEALKLRAGL